MAIDSYQRHLSDLSRDMVKDQKVTIIREIVVNVVTTKVQAHSLVSWSHINSPGSMYNLEGARLNSDQNWTDCVKSGGCSHIDLGKKEYYLGAKKELATSFLSL